MLTFLKALGVTTFCCSALAVSGQTSAQDKKFEPATFEATAGYAYQYSNAPAGACGCFSLNGGFGSFAYNAPHSLSAVGAIFVTHAGSVVGTTQSITYTNFLFGPRYTFRKLSDRFTPYGQLLIGGSHESSNVTQANGLTSFAVSTAVGTGLLLTPHVSLNLLEIDWLHSRLYNNSNNYQDTLGMSTGVTLRFGEKPHK